MFKSFFHYLPVGPIEVKWGAYLAGAGRETVAPGQPYPLRKHPILYTMKWRAGRTLPEYQIVLITGGRGVFESESMGQVPVEAGSLLFLFPDVWHRYRPAPDVGWTERWVSFNGELIHRLYGSQRLGPSKAVCRVGAGGEALLINRFDEFHSRIHSRPTQNSLLYSIHTMSLVADVAELVARLQPVSESLAPKEAANEMDPIVLRTLEIIWTHSSPTPSVDEVASHLPVTRRTLDRKFAEATGHTVLQEINQCRLARAKRLLRETKLPIKVVARLAGFSSREHLRVALHSSVRMTPSEFRADCERRNRKLADG